MSQVKAEKRSTRRFELRLPVSVKSPDQAGVELSAETRDVSARGICFCLQQPLAENTDLEFTLTLPPEITLTESIRVRCFGRVVRVEPGTRPGTMAVAAVIERYEFLGES
ncbi:MAG: PilZ domain-containing protein [Terriglobales bacterium]